MLQATKPKAQGGASLLEVLIAILVLSVGLIGGLKLQSEAVRQNANARYTSLAGLYAMEIMEQIKGGSADFTTWKSKVQSGLPGGNASLSSEPCSGTCKITITWTPPGSPKKQGKDYAEEAVYALDANNR